MPRPENENTKSVIYFSSTQKGAAINARFPLTAYEWNNSKYREQELTAAIEAEESSPAAGCVTSAPKMIVGVSETNGSFFITALSRTVLRPPTWYRSIYAYTYISRIIECTTKMGLLELPMSALTFTLILRATFSKYWWFILDLGLMHWDTMSSSVSHNLLICPEKWNANITCYHKNRGTMDVDKNELTIMTSNKWKNNNKKLKIRSSLVKIPQSSFNLIGTSRLNFCHWPSIENLNDKIKNAVLANDLMIFIYWA
jgi:hypothetical protein